MLAFGATPGKGRDSAILLLDLRTRIVATLPGSEGHYSPRWSPDGRYIATQKVDEPYLMLFDLKTREWKELPRVGVGNQTWSRDGKYLYFSIGVRQDPGCWRVRINDLRLDRVFSFKDLRSPDWWISLAPDDSPLIMTDLGVQEIFAIDWEAP